MAQFKPRLETLPPAQRALWPELGEIPHTFVLYGGTALALRLGHRTSVDFDFFSSEPVIPMQLLGNLKLLTGAKALQSSTNTLTVVVDRDGPIKLSFFGGLTIGRVGEPELTEDGIVMVASLLDIAGTKAAVVYQRAESKDYLDILGLVEAGVPISYAMAAALSLYGERYNPILTLKALSHFGDGDLQKLDPAQKAKLVGTVSNLNFDLPVIPKLSETLSPLTPL